MPEFVVIIKKESENKKRALKTMSGVGEQQENWKCKTATAALVSSIQAWTEIFISLDCIWSLSWFICTMSYSTSSKFSSISLPFPSSAHSFHNHTNSSFSFRTIHRHQQPLFIVVSSSINGSISPQVCVCICVCVCDSLCITWLNYIKLGTLLA